MKIRLSVSLSGPHGAYNAGDEYECSADEAARFVAAGYGEYIRTAPVERAVKPAKIEKAAKGG